MEDWQRLARQKRDSINNLIPEKWRLPSHLPPPEEQRDITDGYIQQYLSQREITFTESESADILRRIHTGEWSAHDVLEAFCHRAALAHQMTNCLHEVVFDDALTDAKRLDEHYKKTGNIVGPLHGLPISLKDQFHVKGVETTMGYVGWVGTFQGEKHIRPKQDHESELVRELRELGALLFCKTAVPHTLMAGETMNNIIGYTWNPKNRFLSAGGSSGGEGALLALRGSPLGIGTDIGGSIRIPAAFNGVYGLKPSSGRLPYEGVATSMDGQNSLLSVVGPMCPSVATLRLLVKSVLSAKPWLHDPLAVELPWRDSAYEEVRGNDQTLTFGVLWNDGQASPHPPVTRALNLVVDAIKRLGNNVIQWKPPSHRRGVDLVYDIWTFDGGHDIHQAFALSGEPPAEQIMKNYGRVPSTEKKASQIAFTNVAKRAYQKEYLDYWESTAELTETRSPVAGFIAPVAPFAAARPGKYDYHGYSMIANILDYSATVLPVTIADRERDPFDMTYIPFSDVDKTVWKSYDPDIYHGTPVGVQLICRRFEEEKVIGLTEMIANALMGDQAHETGGLSSLRVFKSTP